MCWLATKLILAKFSDEDLAEFCTLAEGESQRRRAMIDISPLPGGWQELKLEHLKEVKHQTNVFMLDEEVNDWKRPSAEFVLDLSDGSFANSVEPYRGSLLGPSIRHLRGIYETHHEQQLVYGSHHFYALIGRDNRIQFQGLDDVEFRLNYHIDHQGVGAAYRVPLIARSEAGYQISYSEMSPENTVELSGDVYFGSPIEPTNWGMWLIQGLQSAWRFKVLGEQGRFLCYASEPFQRMLLSFVGVDEAKIIDMAQWRVYRCERLRILQYSHDTSFTIRPSDRQVFDEIVRKATLGTFSVDQPRAIFISRRSVTARKSGTYRPLLNEHDLIDAMERLGLTIVEPELLTFSQQVALFYGAHLVVGLGGAGLFNVVFCRRGARVVTIESSTAFIENHATLFASLELEYGVIFGRRDLTDTSEVHYRWTVDVDAVVDQVQKWL